jgi:hypothetical protein
LNYNNSKRVLEEKKYRLTKKLLVAVNIIVAMASMSIITITATCQEQSNKKNNREVGALLWIKSNHVDQAKKKAIHEILESNSIIVAQISWNPDKDNIFKNTAGYFELAKAYHKNFMINIDFLENDRTDTRGGWRFASLETRSLFKKTIIELVERYPPEYLTLGIEVNYYALTHPKDYVEFVKIYNELKACLHEVRPSLQVGLSFQLELMFGVHRDWEKVKTLQPLDAVVQNLDYLGISTYPDILEYGYSYLRSLHYLDEINQKYNLPFGLLETGISSDNFDDNKRFIYMKKILQKFNSLNMKFLIWGSIIDPPEASYDFNNKYGLMFSNGTPKAEFSLWKDEMTKIQR